MIDAQRVWELRDELGPEEFLPVIELFLDEVEGVLMRLQLADAPRLETQLHFLMGSALNLGFSGMAALCREGEAAARLGRLDRIDLGALMTCYSESKRAFNLLMHRPDAGGARGGESAG